MDCIYVYSKSIGIDNMVPGDLNNDYIKRRHAPPLMPHPSISPEPEARSVTLHPNPPPPPPPSSESVLKLAFNQFIWPGRVPGSEQLSIPYYHIINNRTQEEIYYYALTVVVFTKTLTIKSPFCQQPSFVCYNA